MKDSKSWVTFIRFNNAVAYEKVHHTKSTVEFKLFSYYQFLNLKQVLTKMYYKNHHF